MDKLKTGAGAAPRPPERREEETRWLEDALYGAERAAAAAVDPRGADDDAALAAAGDAP